MQDRREFFLVAKHKQKYHLVLVLTVLVCWRNPQTSKLPGFLVCRSCRASMKDESPIVILEIGTGEWILGSFYLKLVTFGVCGIKSTEDCCLVVLCFYPEILIPSFLYQPCITSFKASLHTWVSCCLAGGPWHPGARSGQRWGFAASAGGAFRREAANHRVLGSEYHSLESWNKLISWVKCFISVVSPLSSICCLKRQVLPAEQSESFTVYELLLRGSRASVRKELPFHREWSGCGLIISYRQP